jgi:hypothetical protein
MLEQSRGEIVDLAMRAIQVLLRQRENPFLNGKRAEQEFAAIDLAAAELAPQPEESGILRQCIAAESLYRVRDLLFGIGDLALLFRDLFGLAEDLLIFVSQLSPQPFDLLFQIDRLRIAMPPTDPPFDSRIRSICPVSLNCYEIH